MQELINIKSQPAVVEVNFDELRDALQKELERYDVVVTADTVADAKKLATELNKTRKVIDDRRKEEVAKASEPVKAFDAQMKELVQLCQKGRQGLIEQIARFEDETKQRAAKLLREYRDGIWEEQAVRDEFKSAQVDDLAILSSLTAKGNLTSKVKEQVRGRVQADKSAQERTDRRLLELDGHSREFGLDVPIERGHVEAFLMADDETYLAKLDSLLNAEQDRQERAKQAERDRIEREQREAEQRQADKERREREAEDARIRAEQEAAEQAANAAAEQEPTDELYTQTKTPSTEWVTVTAVFHIQVPTTASNQSISEALLSKMQDAGFQSTPDIRVERS